VSVIDTATDTVVKTIAVGPEPRGIAITNDGDADDADETVFVTQFLALPVAGKSQGADDAKAGHVSIILTATNTLFGDSVLNPLLDTGFRANGDALGRIPPGANFVFPTGAFPNQLNGIAIHGDFAFVPSTGASPNGPVRFDVNVQSLVSVLSTSTGSDVGRTVNLNLAVQNQTNPARRFLTVPWTLAFEHGADAGWVVSAASNVVAKVDLAPATGALTVALDPADPTRVLELPTGKNPRGIVVNAADTRAFVMNYVSRDVTLIDLTSSPERVRGRIVVEKLPKAKTLEAQIHLGKELYNTSLGGPFDKSSKKRPLVGRMSKDGWGACAACHPFGLSDDVVWIFDAGPRRTIPQHTDFDQTDPTRAQQRALGWSAQYDEETDFELYVRQVMGGDGLLVRDDFTQEPDVPALLGIANTGRLQLSVKKSPAWAAIEAYVKLGIRAPLSPVAKTEPDVVSGRALFTAANCQQCHDGAQWTSSRVRYVPPATPAMVSAGQLFGELRNVGTFDPAAFNEVRANGSPPLGAGGFAPASLLSVAAFPRTFFHNGSAASLTDVMQNVTHRSAGTGGVDTLSSPSDRAKVVRFLESIDAATVPFP
jgi:DNA-binding beta-propeller fold protein YncE